MNCFNDYIYIGIEAFHPRLAEINLYLVYNSHIILKEKKSQYLLTQLILPLIHVLIAHKQRVNGKMIPDFDLQE